MGDYAFFAMMARLKWIDRWALMRNSSNENLSEHSLEVAMIAQALCVIGNERFGKKLDADHAAVIGLFHDVSEILTGDMPTPVKYFNRQIRSAYKDIEQDANMRLLTLLLQELIPERSIADIHYAPQEHTNPDPGKRGIRVDVEVTDADGSRFLDVGGHAMADRDVQVGRLELDGSLGGIDVDTTKYVEGRVAQSL